MSAWKRLFGFKESGKSADTPAAAPAPAPEPTPAEPEAPAGWFGRLRKGLSRSSQALSTGITDIFTKRKLDAASLEDLEDILISADLGADMAGRVTAAIGRGRYEKGIEPEEVKRILAEELTRVLKPVEKPLSFSGQARPFVILGRNPLLAFLGSGAMARLIYSVITVPSGGESVPVQRVIYERLYASWLEPRNASLLFAVSFVLVWIAALAVLHRKRVILKV